MTFVWSSWGFGENKGLKNWLFCQQLVLNYSNQRKCIESYRLPLDCTQAVRDIAKNTDGVTNVTN